MKTNRNILVTGATGFIGSKVTDRLVKLGFKPSVLVRNEDNLSVLNEIKNQINIYQVDITDSANFKKIITRINPQTVIHLAAFGVYTYSDLSFRNIKRMIDSNIFGTINLLSSLKDLNCELFINTGSCFEYGNSKKPFNEYDKLAPTNMYGITKVASTQIAHQMAKTFNIKICTLRPFTVYGPGASPKRFITTVINNCLNNQDIKIPQIDITRDFIYIDDVAQGYLMVFMENKLKNDLIINLSTGIGKSLEETAFLVKKLVNSENEIKKGEFPIRDGEVLSLIGSNETARNILNWKPRYTLEEGLKLMLAAYPNK